MGKYDDEFDAAFSEADKEFKSRYKDILATMRGFSAEELEQLTPTVTDRETYRKLISVVQEATDKNLAIADLRSKIKNLGDAAVKMAGKISGLNTIVKV